ncbi:MAG: 2-phosphosulfolactate phosphatase [Candidatus Kapaibacterium sp.]|nr:2-phosphosulfolactate phosphatase [Ignavibacteriota bacterium]MCB9220423.1 2-phosphosulfolactate phosphatase [Ignavibacteria bacterium]
MATLNLFSITNKYSGFQFETTDTVILIDIYRATSTIVTAFGNGVKEIIPCVEIEQVSKIKNKNNEILGACERNGKKIDGMDFDNSPVSFNNANIADKIIAISTTNCTKAIEIAKNTKEIIFASFLNLDAVCNYITDNVESIERCVILCAGNKKKESEEDNLFASELIFTLNKGIDLIMDERSFQLFSEREEIPFALEKLINSTHAKRLISLEKRKDIDFSLIFNKFDCVPIYANHSIKKK